MVLVFCSHIIHHFQCMHASSDICNGGIIHDNLLYCWYRVQQDYIVQMGGFYFHLFIHHCFFLFHFTFLKTAKFIGIETMPVVLVSFSFFNTTWSGLNSRRIISILSISSNIITGTLHVLHVYVHMQFILRGWLYLGAIWCNFPFTPTTIERCIFTVHDFQIAIFILVISARLVTVMLFFIIFIKLRVRYMTCQYTYCYRNGLWVLAIPQRKLGYKYLESVTYLDWSLTLINRNNIYL